MNDIKLAMLGNRDAAKRLTYAGVLLPCPWCYSKHIVLKEFGLMCFVCADCAAYGPSRKTENAARLAWNTRAPILSAEEMEMLNEH